MEIRPDFRNAIRGFPSLYFTKQRPQISRLRGPPHRKNRLQQLIYNIISKETLSSIGRAGCLSHSSVTHEYEN